MTTIVATREINNGRPNITMVADSCFTDGEGRRTISTRTAKMTCGNVRGVDPNGKECVLGIIIGVSGDPTVVQYLQNDFFDDMTDRLGKDALAERFDLSVNTPHNAIIGLVRDLKAELKDMRLGTIVDKDGKAVFDGSMLIGFYGELFVVDSNFHVMWVDDAYAAIGSGSDIALGALCAMAMPQGGKVTQLNVETAIIIASKYDSQTSTPIEVVVI